MTEPGQKIDAIDPGISRETPTDIFRRRIAERILLALGGSFLILILFSGFVLYESVGATTPINEQATNAAQTILTTCIGFIGGAGTTVVGFFFQARQP